MYRKLNETGKRGKVSLALVIANIIFSFCIAVISAHMANKGCSPVYIAVAILSFIYIAINILLIVWSKTWERIPMWIIIVLIFIVFLTTLVGLGYSNRQSICEMIICGSNFQSKNDDFQSWFNGNDRKASYDKVACGHYSDDMVKNDMNMLMNIYGNTVINEMYAIRKGWPIAFTVIQFILCLIQIILSYFSMYSCKGCKQERKEQQYNYF